MRQFLCMAMVSVSFLSEAGVVPTNMNRSINAPNALAIPSRLGMNASNTSGLMDADNSLVNVTDFASSRSDEARVNPQFLDEALETLSTSEALGVVHPAELYKRLGIQVTDEHDLQVNKIKQWFKHVDAYRIRDETYGETSEINDMLGSAKKFELARFLHRLRGVPGMKGRADSLQKALASILGRNTGKIFPLWLEDGVTPIKAYYMMPIPRKTTITGVEKEKYQCTAARRSMLEKWLDYVHDYVEKGHVYGNDAIVSLLVDKQGKEESVEFFHYLRLHTYKSEVAVSLQRALAVEHPDTLELMFKLWLNDKVDPGLVYEMMPIAAEKGLKGLHNREWWPDIYDNLMKWREYVKAFNDQRHAEMEYHRKHTYGISSSSAKTFSEDDVFSQLILHSVMEDLVAFLGYIQSVMGMDSFVSKMYKYLFKTSPVETEDLIFDQWVLLDLEAADVYDSMPISIDVDELKAIHKGFAPQAFCVYLEQLLRYVDRVRTRDQVRAEFSDDVLISLLKENASAESLRDYLKELGKGHRKERASQLLAALDADG
uniref:RxLR effector candidate protein n=1 Tax=Peronospora matthiolae TaxID=2874970 RepID=A0AAV1UCQ3_9STRA